jgi:hypothetical protein
MMSEVVDVPHGRQVDKLGQVAAQEPILAAVRPPRWWGNDVAIADAVTIAQHINGQLLPPWPNAPALAIVVVPCMRLATCGPDDDRRVAVTPQRVLQNTLVGSVNIQHRDAVGLPRREPDRGLRELWSMSPGRACLHSYLEKIGYGRFFLVGLHRKGDDPMLGVLGLPLFKHHHTRPHA